MGVVSRRWMWMESMGVASGCGSNEEYIFPHFTYLYSALFAASLIFFILKMFFVLVPVLFYN